MDFECLLGFISYCNKDNIFKKTLQALLEKTTKQLLFFMSLNRTNRAPHLAWRS
jgi:hypothetical protein